mmetsp:Transcript_112712/g.313591  ORF Transcript_112712/g.313591 Transcript_112712/m.313591 type:complete len:173 (+) Transcript_112712:149-667(+)|eukprot:CAMPEP_0179039200 /NCGR_PEP_ID=MMETSP0796-20121207/15022_1 /TAXON_ID=73915 /ORGANISM="Pyrodinium bahamense, Strain pbaha01" /LENGTH=172 /DNA_ID=CAMNT_0020735533 /DNA_START=174 /DNA_END=692 /DNA_ORIENTATION=+
MSTQRQAHHIIRHQGSSAALSYLNGETYSTGTGEATVGGETFYYCHGFVLNTTMSVPWPIAGREFQIVAYHGTLYCNLESILKNGLLVGNPRDCQTFNGDVYGTGIYCSPRQDYAKSYARGDPQPLGSGSARLVLGLRLRNSAAITKTSDPRIWVIKRAEDVKVQDINLTYD